MRGFVSRRTVLAATAASALATTLTAARVRAQSKDTAQPIRIGEINSYSTIPQFLLPYRKAWELAVDEINTAGGVLGRRIEVISRDDAGKPDEAVRHATELVSNEHVDLLAGTFLSNVGLAVADFALRNHVLFVASEPLSDALVWEKGNRYTFRLRASTFMQSAMLIDDAQSAVTSFKALLKAHRPDVEFVAEQWPGQGKLEAGSTVQAVLAAQPEAIFNVTFGADLARLVREGNLRGLFPRVPTVSLLSGEPEYLDVLKDETPTGWIVTGYPWDQIPAPEHARFFNAYYQRYRDNPRLGSVVGYSMMQAIIAAIAKAKQVATEPLIKALRGLTFTTPFGPVTFRALDHQSTMGAFVGKLAVRADKGTMVDWHYADGKSFLPSDDEVRKRRPAEAML